MSETGIKLILHNVISSFSNFVWDGPTVQVNELLISIIIFEVSRLCATNSYISKRKVIHVHCPSLIYMPLNRKKCSEQGAVHLEF